MLILLKGGRIIDPAYNDRDEIGDLWIEDGHIIAAPQGRLPDKIA